MNQMLKITINVCCVLTEDQQ